MLFNSVILCNVVLCNVVQCSSMHRYCVDRYKTILRKAAPLVLKSKVDIVFWEEGYRCSRSGTDDWIVVTSKSMMKGSRGAC